MLEDRRAVCQVLGCLILNPSLLHEKDKYQLSEQDFTESFHVYLFKAINNLYVKGNKDIDFIAIDNYLSQYGVAYKVFNDNNGIDYIQNIVEDASLDNFDYNYNRLKKFTLLRAYQKNGIDITDIYDESIVVPKAQEEMQYKFDNYSIEDIVTLVDKRIMNVKDLFLMKSGSHGQHAAKGLKELKEALKKEPEMGASLCSGILNAVTRGARLKKLYMRSAPTGVGKTRLSLGDSTNLAVDEIWDLDMECWVNNGKCEPTLFITTELEMDEVQTPMLAFISGVSEEKILDGKYSKEEEARVDKAIEIMDRATLWIEHLPNFDIDDIERIIHKNVLLNGVKYVFFDYVHISMKLLEEMTKASKGMKLREDNVLLMFVDKLKTICNALGVHISTSTQVNGEWKTAKDADQNLLRGAKAMADKVDIGIVALEPTKADLDALESILVRERLPRPNIVLHIYKNRRGKLVRVKIWQYVDLSTCRTRDLFVTDRDYNVIPVQALKIKTQ